MALANSKDGFCFVMLQLTVVFVLHVEFNIIFLLLSYYSTVFTFNGPLWFEILCSKVLQEVVANSCSCINAFNDQKVKSLGDRCCQKYTYNFCPHLTPLNRELKLDSWKLYPISKRYMERKQPIYMYHIDAANLTNKIDLHFLWVWWRIQSLLPRFPSCCA